ncbi:MAG: hypothetical protein BIP78_1495 [Candidatus Bipolaricaulis sibiricus]|uniref:Photosystem I biogenesis protein BtpA n=1 Tax=Bipolaricaulis sibiricus TaxID=2501609 RepID=A0A410FWC4_BIPS1|nr:MAG: hypothetical protein BIP78_1495 [Candidatus Bipolaricaulis sibiricus]
MGLPWHPSSRPLIGVIHLPPLPGTPRGSLEGLDPVLARSQADLGALEAGGADGAIVENFGDAPFRKKADPATVAALAIVVRDLVRRARIPLGVNVLRSDGVAAMAIASLAGASFIRVNVFAGTAFTDQGIIEGEAREILELRRALGGDVAVLADVHVKHAVHFETLAQAARDAARNGPDALIVTGGATGDPAVPADIRVAKDASGLPVFVGSGVGADRIGLYPHADGFIVGTALKVDGRVGNPVDPPRVRALVKARDRLLG